eukprot:CAMPEP_0172447676 /NCGR_PEP_ID=MMETSP1065-20121228/6941_1 /TAXON_ID=265537 /ORGANISM="Amphiprora paludosa, Strain CCMP125" /LENGTH=350 /DNA_ID=CAMNT_0013199039 /DNA_START=252 /DNA_END=1304 /DNA_ORIENTATION=-
MQVATTPAEPCRSFSLFPYLHDDLKLTILSFVADAPFEPRFNRNSSRSGLTHALPQVSRKFQQLSDTDFFWKHAILRQVENEPFLWKTALERMVATPTAVAPATRTVSQGGESSEPTSCSLVPPMPITLSPNETLLIAALEQKGYPSFKAMYQDIVTYHLRYVGPVFCMGGQVTLGEPYGLHFFEPRYRALIAQVMKDQPPEAKCGGRVLMGQDNASDPIFIHANRGPLEPTTPATLVRVQRCEIFPDGRANVELLPIAHVWLEKIWVQPRSGTLHFAQCFKMGQDATHSMNQLARQEQLAHVMSHLADHLSAEDRNGGRSNGVGHTSSSGGYYSSGSGGFSSSAGGEEY